MSVVASQLVGKVSVQGVQQAQSSLKTMGTATDLLARKFADFKPFQAGKAVTQEDVLKSRLATIEVQVEKTRAKLQTLKDAADAGQAVTGIPELLVKLNSLEVRAQKTRDQLASLHAPTESLGSKLKTLASRALEAGTSFGGRLASGLKSAVSGFLDIGSKLSMITLGISALVQGAVSLGQQLLQPAMSAEQLGTAFETLMGSTKAATKQLRELKRFADVTPFEPQDVEQYAAQLIGMGIQANRTIPIMTALGDALFAIGKGTPAEMASVVDIIGKINTVGKLTGDDLTQLGEHGIAAAKILAQQFGVSTEEIYKMASQGIDANKAINALTKGIESNPIYKGGMAKQANSLAGIFSTLSGYVTDATNSFLGLQDNKIVKGSLLDDLKNNINGIIEVIKRPDFQKFAADLGGKVGQALTNISHFISSDVVPAFQKLSDWWQNVSRAFDTVGFQDLVKSLQKLGDTIGTVLEPVLKPLADDLKSLFSDDSSASQSVALADAFESLAQSIDGLRGGIEFMQASWPQVQAAMAPVIDTFQQIGGFLVDQFGPIFKDISNTVQSQLVPAWNELVKALEPAMPLLEGIGAVLGTVLLGVLGIVIASVVGLAKGIAGAIPGIIQAIGGIIQVFTGLVQFFTGIVDFIYDLFTGNFGKLGADIGLIWQGIVNQFMGIVNIIVGLFNSMVGTVSGFISGFVSTIIGFFTHLWDVLVGHSIVPDMINAIIDWFGKLPGRVIAFLVNLVGGIGARFNEGKEVAIRYVSMLYGEALVWWARISKSISDKAAEIKGNILRPFQQARDALTGIAKSIGNAAIDGLNVGIRGSVDFVNRFADAINAVATALGQKGPIGHLQFKGLPHYAKGTPGGGHPQDGPAVVGEEGRELIWLPKGAHVIPHAMTEKMLRGGVVPGYAGGTPGIDDILGWIGGGAQGVLNSMLSSFHIGPPSLPGSLGNFAGAVLGKVKDWALGWIEKALPSFGGGEGGGSFGTAISGNLRSWIMAGMALTHTPGSWFNALATIAMHESGGNPNAINNYDINAKNGDPSRGLFQTIGATFSRYALPGHGNIFSGIDNTAAAIGYIKSRYGDVFHVPGIMALSQGKNYIGYANGGIITEPIAGIGLRTGTNYAFGERGPERVSPLSYMPAGTSAIASGGGTQPIIHVTVNVPPATLNVDGNRLAQTLMPAITNQIRYGVGSVGF